jgi:glycosyltransferase involved in cell wall biosynthesis
MDAQTPRLRVAVVTTRDIGEQNGRAQVLSAIVTSLSRQYNVKVIRLLSIAETKSWMDLARAAWRWAVSLLKFRPMPLQCLLYASDAQCQSTASEIVRTGCDAVYLDTVRCQALLHVLRRERPDLHIVTDFDDLMSRRATFLADKQLAFSTGHTGRHFPRWLRYLIDVALAPAVTTYEAFTLPAAEHDVVARSDATVLISRVDRQHLCKRLPHDVRVHAIGPAFRLQRLPWNAAAPLRFVFVGSDSFVQNRTAIDFLTRYWSENVPATPLHIYGRQRRSLPQIPGVRWHGYVDDIAEAYHPGSIALVPALDRGGIKTKVLEAWSWGCPVLGNAAAFEGLPVADYPLMSPENDWHPFLTDPAAHMANWLRAAGLGSTFVRRIFSPEKFENAWCEIMLPASIAVTARPGTALRNASTYHAV